MNQKVNELTIPELDNASMQYLLKIIAANTFDSVMITTAEPGTAGPPIVYVNDAFTEMTGFSAAEIIGKTPGILQGNNTDQHVLVRLAQDLMNGQPFHGKAINYRRDWSEFLMEWKIFPVRNGSGDITHFVALQRDVTALEQVNQQDVAGSNRYSHQVSPTNRRTPMSTQINIGISEEMRGEIGQGLSRLLADTYTLYLKTHNFHWNVTGPLFNSLHLMFEEQYNELALAVDAIAERIRTLGFPAPGSYAQFGELTSIREETEVPSAEEMIRQLVDDQETVARTARSVFPIVEEANDQPTADLLTQRMQVHEKTAWMLRSLLG